MNIRSAGQEEIEEIRELLVASSLPAEDVSDAAAIMFLVAANDANAISGCVGLEAYGTVGLLRSLAVAKDARGLGIGHALVAAAENAARMKGMAQLYLLTTTASQLFVSIGYNAVARSEVPESLRSSTQFASLCPASATCMRKLIEVA